MTLKERVIAALNHQKTDYIPYTIGFTKEAHKKVAKYLGDPEFHQKIDNHIKMFHYDGNAIEISTGQGYWKDDFGVVWNRNVDKDIGVVDDYILKEPSLTGCKFPEPNEQWLRNIVEGMLKDSPDTFNIVGIGCALFERAWSLRGMENIMMDMIDNPGFVDELFEKIADYNMRFMDIALEYDIDGFYFGDDWGQQKGMIMGPQYWKRYIRPHMKRLFDRVKSKGRYVAHHSCGDIYEIFPEVIDIGMDIFRTFQPEVYDIKKVKNEYGRNLTFWGGISTQQLLPFATPDEVKRVTRETMKIMGKDGGYIVAPTHGITPDTPVENIIAFLEVLQNQ